MEVKGEEGNERALAPHHFLHALLKILHLYLWKFVFVFVFILIIFNGKLKDKWIKVGAGLIYVVTQW